MSDPTPYLDIAIRAMRRKAFSPKNVAKASWRDMTDAEVDRRIFDEVEELRTAMKTGDSDAILSEAVDIVAFAAMRSDPHREGPGYPHYPPSHYRPGHLCGEGDDGEAKR